MSQPDNAPPDYGATSNPPSLPSTSSKRTLNDVYEILGLGPFQYLVWILVLLVAYSDYAELTLLSVMIPALRCEWGLTKYFEAAITFSVFVSYAVCAILFGKVGDVYGRKPVVLISTIVLLLSAVVSALAPNKWVFLVGRMATGGCIGVNLGAMVCYTTEYAESKYRAVGVLIMIMGSFIGGAAVNILGYFLLNSFGWRWFIIVVSAPVVPAIIFIALLPESPRYLCVSGQTEELNAVLGTIAKLNRATLPESLDVVVYQDEELGSYRVLFNETNRRSVISLSVAYFANIVLEFGLIIFLPLFFSSQYCGAESVTPAHNCRLLSQEDLWKLSVSSFAAIIGAFLAFLFASLIGRLIPLRIGSFFVLVCLFGLLICISHTVTFAIVSALKLAEAIVNTLLWIIIPETFATCLRSTAIGFINGWGKVGGVLGTGMVYLLFYVSPTLVIGVFISASLLAFVASLVFNKETKDLELQEV